MTRMSRLWSRPLPLLLTWTLGCWLLFHHINKKETQSASCGPLMSSPSPATRETVDMVQVEPRLDRSPKLSEEEVASRIQDKMPNLPIVYWQALKDKIQAHNSTCAKFPSIVDLKFNNQYWQVVETSNGTFHLYGAYLDVRAANRLGPSVRILGMINRLEPKVETFCQMWFSNSKEPEFSPVLEYKYIWNKKWGNYKQGLPQPYLLACQLPKSNWGQNLVSVSVVEHKCDNATNNLRVIYNKLREGEEKKNFAVCVKGLDFPEDDLSVRLIEWIELLTTLGADKIFLYQLEVHPNVSRVLEHYTREGKVDVTPISLPGYQPNLPDLRHMYLAKKRTNKRQNELIPYNDCLYRNIYRYKYISLLDIDEVITPIKHLNWADMMKEAVAASLEDKDEETVSWSFRNVYFMDEMLEDHEGPHNHFKNIPSYLHMLQHVYRSANYTKPGAYVKCFHNPERVLILHNHYPFGCISGACTKYQVDTGIAHLQHYRSDCVSNLKKTCEDDFKSVSVKDTTIWRWKECLINRTSEALVKLGFL